MPFCTTFPSARGGVKPGGGAGPQVWGGGAGGGGGGGGPGWGGGGGRAGGGGGGGGEGGCFLWGGVGAGARGGNLCGPPPRHPLWPGRRVLLLPAPRGLRVRAAAPAAPAPQITIASAADRHLIAVSRCPA